MFLIALFIKFTLQYGGSVILPLLSVEIVLFGGCIGAFAIELHRGQERHDNQPSRYLRGMMV